MTSTIHPDALQKLSIASPQIEAARSAGSIRNAVSDAYSGVDNCFSAILFHGGIEPSHRHNLKLAKVRDVAPELSGAARTDWGRVEQIYKLWLDARYKEVDLTPTDVLDITRICRRIQEAAFDLIGGAVGMSRADVEREVYRSMWGSRWRAADEHVSHVHDHWQDMLERAGEDGTGSRLGNKMVNPSNFSNVLLLSDDAETNTILNEDEEIGHFIGHMYHDFLRLVIKLQDARGARGVDVQQAANFMFGLRFSYHGQSLEEIAEDFARIFGAAFDGKGIQRVTAPERNERP